MPLPCAPSPQASPKPLIAGLDLSNGACLPPPPLIVGGGPGRGDSGSITRTSTPTLPGPAYIPGRTGTPSLPPSNLSGLPRPPTPAATPRALTPSQAGPQRTATPNMGHEPMQVRLPACLQRRLHTAGASSCAACKT